MSAAAMDPGREAFDFIDAIEAMPDERQVIKRFGVEVAKYGFHAWLITGLPAPGDKIDPLMVLNGWPEGWTQLYTSQNFVGDDPVATHCYRSIAPFEWTEAPYDPIVWPQAQIVMERARDFRMMRGFCVPLHTGEGFQAAVTMAGERVDLTGRAKPALHLMALYAHSKAVELAGARTAARRPRVLTRREREVLKWTAAGKTSWETSQILGISEQTVTAHIKAAGAKLDTHGRTATVVTAIRRGEITI